MKKPNLPKSFFQSSFRALPWLACGPSLILCHGWQEREEKAPGAQVYGISQDNAETALANGAINLRKWPVFAVPTWHNLDAITEKEVKQAESAMREEYADAEERNPLVVWEYNGERVA